MTTIIEMAQMSDKKAREGAVENMVIKAKELARDPDWDAQRVYEVTADVINDFNKDFNWPDDECKNAVEQLREALNI